ncbi:MAG: SIS domain-containing protein [Planctomycetota bacterium]
MAQPTGAAAIRAELDAAAAALDALRQDESAVKRIAQVGGVLANVLDSGGKILACGNGGSCADAMHFCEELTGRYQKDRKALGAIACGDGTHLTCVANDFGYEAVFSRFVEGLGRAGDALIVLSTSGNSKNVINAVETARSIGITTIALLGKDGGALKGTCDHEWIAAGGRADRIQEVHMLILHTLIGEIERVLGYA